ncbi:MAG: hypothetical protein H7X77_04735, partial [Anaerolineae bacterium]|nr:hypothetical protein [Anaerolineae bacterium]
MGNLSLFQTFTLIANILSMSMAGGLAFSVLVQPKRGINNYLFAVFSIAMGLWALTSLLINTPPGWANISGVVLLQVRVTVMGMVVLTYFFFVIAFIKPAGLVVRVATVLAIVVGIFVLVVIWTGGMYVDPNAVALLNGTRPAFTTLGYLSLGTAVSYLFLTFWLILSSGKPHARLLRLPTMLLLLAYASLVPETTIFASFDTFLIAIAAVWIGWAVMRHQVFNPLNELNAEMRTANRDLQQVINDLAAEKSRAEALNTDLRAANTYKSEFLANMSHELRTPLNSIIGYSELLRQGVYGELNPKQGDRLEKIHRNGAQLLELISDILDLNKLESGKLRLDIEFFEFAPLVEEALEKYQPGVLEKNLQTELLLPPNLPKLYGDPRRIHQVLDNLIDNAVKFTREGSIKIEARTVIITKGVITYSDPPDFNLPTVGWLRDGQWMIFNVTDTGIGIVPENQARIFDEFAQVDGSRTREFGGTGLGLAISQRLITLHSG